MQHLLTYTPPSRSSSLVTAFSVALFLVFFGVANGLASQQVKAMRVLKAQLVGNGWPNLSSQKPMYYFYYIGERPSYLLAFPFLQDLRLNVQNNGSLVDYVPYGNYPLNNGGYPKYPYFYRVYSDINAGTVPDDWTQTDIDGINQSYNALTEAQKLALPGTFVAGNLTSGDASGKFFQFNLATVGTAAYNGGVYTYDFNGDVVVSFPDNTGYASGYKPLPDGTYTPVYYTVENNVVTEYSDITPPSYDTLTIDDTTGNYSLSIPNYNKQLDKIINKLDNIELTYDPQIAVYPNVSVTSSVSVTPEITLDPVISVTNSVVLSSGVEDALYIDSDVPPSGLSTNDFSLTQDEQSAVSSLRSWETNIPLIGESIDFGLTTLLGRIPAIGTEYVWMDHTVGSNTRSSALPSFRIFISLERYRDVILALRGFLILFEALLFLVMTYRNIREALKV